MKVDVILTSGKYLGAGSFLGFNGSLLAHSGEDDNVGVLLLNLEELVDLLTNFSIGDLDIILGLTIISHQGEETVIGDIEKLVFLAGNVGDVHVVGRWAKVFKLLAGEDVNGDKMNLGVTVLAGLRGGHVDNLARAVLDADEAVLPQGRALHGVSGRSAGIGRIEGVLMLGIVGVRHVD